jgi:hypothetical protein
MMALCRHGATGIHARNRRWIPAEKLSPLLKPEVAEHAWPARASWRVFGIMAEFVDTTERLCPISPTPSAFANVRPVNDPAKV